MKASAAQTLRQIRSASRAVPLTKFYQACFVAFGTAAAPTSPFRPLVDRQLRETPKSARLIDKQYAAEVSGDGDEKKIV